MPRLKGVRPHLVLLALLLSCFTTPAEVVAEVPSAQSLTAFTKYIDSVGVRLAQQRQNGRTYLALSPGAPNIRDRVRHGEVVIERLTPEAATVGSEAWLHHWRGTAFAPGATARSMQELLTRVETYPSVYRPEVLRAALRGGTNDASEIQMRVRQHHVLTVTLEMTYATHIGRPDGGHGSCDSRSLRVAEVEKAGTAAERVLRPEEGHGFLWQQNTYWSYAEGDGGLYLQLESISLTRSAPMALSWAIRPYLDSVPRESLQFTLQATARALTK